MDHPKYLTAEQNAMVILSFFHTDYVDERYENEILYLSKDLKRTFNFEGLEKNCDGELESDSSASSAIASYISGIQPSVGERWPGNREELAAVHEIARGLREIAQQFNQNIVAQATHNLATSILSSSHNSTLWKDHLSQQVRWAITHGVSFQELSQERIIMALSLTMVKGVCQSIPHLLSDLFQTLLHYLNSSGAR